MNLVSELGEDIVQLSRSDNIEDSSQCARTYSQNQMVKGSNLARQYLNLMLYGHMKQQKDVP